MLAPMAANKTKNEKPDAGAWWLYVLECRGAVLYTGIAKDVDARFQAHLKGSGAKFTRSNRPVRIVAKTPLATRGDALRAEHALKQLARADKLRWCRTGLKRFAARLALERQQAVAARLDGEPGAA
jgi:putative endonuclease